MHRVAFVTSHPIQYQVPVFRHLAQMEGIDLTVLFAQIPDAKAQGDGFGVDIKWDIPLLGGYKHRVLNNIATEPSVTRFSGCDTPEIGKVIDELQLDGVMVNGWNVKTGIQTLRACRKRKIPCLVRGEANHIRPRPWWKKVLQRQLVRRYSGYLYIGEANKAFYKSYGVTDDQLFPARYCIENDRFRENADDATRRQPARERWGVPEGRVCFLFSGKLIEKKHPVELLEAFRNASKRGMQAHLLIVGDGELRSECEKIVSDSKLAVTFTGFLNQSEIVDAYCAADVLVLPSDYGETWGLVTNEAMACARPAIVSDQVGCCQDLIEEGVTGWSFPFGDWNALADLLERSSTLPEELSKMGKEAQQKIEAYSPLEAARGMHAALNRILN